MMHVMKFAAMPTSTVTFSMVENPSSTSLITIRWDGIDWADLKESLRGEGWQADHDGEGYTFADGIEHVLRKMSRNQGVRSITLKLEGARSLARVLKKCNWHF